MRIFVTGASGFIGSELTQQLLAAGHQVRGMARSEQGLAQIEAAGAETFRGDLTDLDSLRRGASGMDAVAHLAFNHDFSKFADSSQDEIKAIETLGAALEPGKLLIVTSGVLGVAGEPGQVRTEHDPALALPSIPRQPEVTGKAVAERGVHVGIVRLPQVHDTRKQGLVTYLIQIARDKGVAAYVGDGSNRWAAAPLRDVATLYQLALEKTGPGVTTYHAVEESGVPLRDIAETIAKGLGIEAKSITPEEAAAHFGPFGHFVGLDVPVSSEWTRKTLDWHPAGPSMVQDLLDMQY